MEESTAFIDEWPKVSFADIANEKVDGSGALQTLYKSFFKILLLPEATISSIITLFREEPK